MSNWIFVTTNHADHGLSGTDIFTQRMADGFWGLGEKTPNRKALRKGDRVVWYVGNPVMAFAGTATLDGPSYPVSVVESEQLSHGNDFYKSEYGVRFSEIEIWHNQRLIKELVPALKFIESKHAWYTYFQGGVRQISDEDFQLVIGSREVNILEQIRAAKDLEDESEFVLESHLEEFMAGNWSHINFHAPLNLYQIDDQNGRQFPAGPWSIDFLCTDRTTNDFVVLELKRGKSSDAAVGQVLRYMSWVRENLTSPGQKVRGIIIARDADEALRYAVKAVPDVDILTYRVDFLLSPLSL